MPKNRRGSIVTYDITEHVVKQRPGLKPEEKANYDIMTAVILGLDDLPQGKDAGALEMLTTALSSKISVEEKKKVLTERFGVQMSRPLEKAVINMCNLSEYVLEQGVERGIEQGIEQGRLETFFELTRDNLISVKDAARKLKMTETDFVSAMNRHFALTE